MKTITQLDISNIKLYLVDQYNVESIYEPLNFEFISREIKIETALVENLVFNLEIFHETKRYYSQGVGVRVLIDDIYYITLPFQSGQILSGVTGDHLKINTTFHMPLPMVVFEGNEPYLTKETYKYFKAINPININSHYGILSEEIHDFLIDQGCTDSLILDHFKNWVQHKEGCSIINNALRHCE